MIIITQSNWVACTNGAEKQVMTLDISEYKQKEANDQNGEATELSEASKQVIEFIEVNNFAWMIA